VVRKGRRAAIAADTLTSLGDQGLAASYKVVPEKVFRLGDSFVAMTGNPVNRLVLESIVARDGTVPALSGRREIFEWLRGMHSSLKEDYFVNTKEGEKDTYESMQMNFLLANSHGIFGVHSDRDVYEYSRFWATGSGGEYALGAMAAVYEREQDAGRIAEIGVVCATEFDRSSAEPITVFTLDLANERQKGTQQRQGSLVTARASKTGRGRATRSRRRA